MQAASGWPTSPGSPPRFDPYFGGFGDVTGARSRPLRGDYNSCDPLAKKVSSAGKNAAIRYLGKTNAGVNKVRSIHQPRQGGSELPESI
jgi:hypothetical protein